MNQQNQNSLRRWTDPTNLDFYNKNAQGIKRYAIATWIVQTILGFLAYVPASSLLTNLFQNAPMALPYVPYFVVGFLLLLHYVLHEEALEALSNALDNDDATTNAWHDWAVPALICIVMIAADISGARYTLFHLAAKDETIAISGENTSLKNEANSKYKADISDIEKQYGEQIGSVATPYNSRIASIRRKKCYDDDDRRKNANQVAIEVHNRDNAVASLVAEKANELKKVRQERDESLKKAGVRKDSFESKNAVVMAYAEDNARNGSWIITVGCWVLFGFMIFRLVYLRIESGIKPVRAYTQMDAMGSPLNNFIKATKDGLTRQSHRFNAWWHEIMSTGADKVPGLDFTVEVREAQYNGKKIENTIITDSNDNNGGQTQSPPPMPPIPPTTGGNGGGGKTPPTPLVPVPENTEVVKFQFNNQLVDTQKQTVESFQNAFGVSETDLWSIFSKINPEFCAKDGCPFLLPSEVEKVWIEIKLLNPTQSVPVPDSIASRVPSLDSLQAAREDLGENASETEVEKLARAYDTPRNTTPTPSVENEIPEPVVTVIEAPKTVVTPEKTVTTEKIDKNNPFSYGDNVLRSMKQEFQKELNNIKIANGKRETVINRLIQKSKEFDTAVRTVKATPKLRNEICNWVLDNVSPVIASFLREGKEGSAL